MSAATTARTKQTAIRIPVDIMSRIEKLHDRQVRLTHCDFSKSKTIVAALDKGLTELEKVFAQERRRS